MSNDRPEQLRLSDMPVEELKTLCGQLLLKPPSAGDRDELARSITRQLTLINQLDRDGLLDIVVHAHRPVSRSADKLALVREISHIKTIRYDGLSLNGLIALARLRGLSVPDSVTDRQLRSMLARDDGIRGWFARKRRALVAGVVGQLLDADGDPGEYQFLPDERNGGSLRRQIEQQGVVGGIASKLKGAADDYLNAKLDEIEHRIDRKLDEIDQRLSEWRDQEISNRLKIIKITLIGMITIALVSLIYSYLASGQ